MCCISDCPLRKEQSRKKGRFYLLTVISEIIGSLLALPGYICTGAYRLLGGNSGVREETQKAGLGGEVLST